MVHVEYLNNFAVMAVEAIRDLVEGADAADFTLAALSNREWLELKPTLLGFVGNGGRLRIVVRRDTARTSSDALADLLRLENTQLAFSLADTAAEGNDYLFHYPGGQRLALMTSAADSADHATDPLKERPAIVKFSEATRDPAARRAQATFERRWQDATPMDEAALAAFRAAVGPSPFHDGDLVRSTNPLYILYGIGRIQKIRGPHAKVEYNPSVFMEPPYRSENKILQLEEVERIDSPLERAGRGEWGETWRFELKMMAARFLTGNIGGQLSNARTEILPHQIFAAHRVVSSVHRRFLLADEVGLGKTIEAGMIWQALAQRGQARRTLIVTPAGLTTQWQEELQDKFGARFQIFGRDFTAVNPRVWDYQAQAIASIDTLKRAEHKRILLENRKWDLVIFDEAHRLSAMDYGSGKLEKTQNYRLAEELRHKQYCEALLLLTATPHQGEENHSRFKNLVGLLGDDIDFTGLEHTNLFSGTGTRFTELVIRTPKKDVTDAQGQRVFRGRQTHRLPFKMYDDEARFYKAVAKYIQEGYRALERLGDHGQRRAAGFLLTTFQKLNASSTAAIKASLEARLRRLKGRLKQLPKPEDDEDDMYDERYEGEFEESAVLKDDRQITADEILSVEKLMRMKITRDRKLDELLRLIDHIAQESSRRGEEKILIFTEYRETQRHLVRELEACYGKGSVVVIHGGMKLERRGETDSDMDAIWAPFAIHGALDAASTKRTSQRLFRDHGRVRFLVSTEAGGEGINLQFCHICINYDLPWNPMRVEQRVGRVYRFGQSKVVQVFNFLNQGTIEDKVQSYFEDRLENAAMALAKVTGENPEDIKGTLNGQLESEIDPAKIYQRAMVEGNLNKQTQKEIEEAVGRARKAYEIATQSLFRDVSSYSFDNYKRELAADLTLADLERFTEKFLAAHRRQLQRKTPFVEFLVPDVLRSAAVPERLRTATFDRALAIIRSDAEFLALGHPFIDAMLAHVGSYDFGGLTACRRISAAPLVGQTGYLFLFIVRHRIARELNDECLFRFERVFVDSQGRIDDVAAALATAGEASDGKCTASSEELEQSFLIARRHLEEKIGLWDWDDDVEFLGISAVEFQ